VRAFLLREAARPAPGLGARAAARFGLSRQAVHLHLAALVREGVLEGVGRTRAKVHRLATLWDRRGEIELGPSLDEDEVWQTYFAPAAAALPTNVAEIVRFGLCECLRNAADHSGASSATGRLRRNALTVEVSVADRGTGLFRRLDPLDPLRAALEVAKGGATTDPTGRSGLGLESLARAFDTFSVWSGGHLLRRESVADEPRWTLRELGGRVRGTTLSMTLGTRSRRTLAGSIACSSVEEAGIIGRRMEIPVPLALRGDGAPTTRLAARRLLARAESAREVVLDFAGIEAVGPAFADEVARVFPREHPQVRIVWTGANATVERALRAVARTGGGA
jgi:anti-sigma regulatory factor (Ser/Thr protein kinase)